ncbi:MAG: DNA-3-methyladenine glycosylase [Bacteroidetes bacterium]|nr:DNA-3-methyladenine glycosylase [Bacteroidota bacterium]MBL6942930.1 DNA-3-methyladenine glycosylase [Bacteroidales bacterium]
MSKLPISYYLGEDVESIACFLLGKFLYTNINNQLTGGIITETEAYKGVSDKASHAYGGKLTKRTEVMFKQGGVCYVYLCYGVHYLLNVVTADEGVPHAVLIRGIYPLIGINHMFERTGKQKANYKLTNGPGKLTKALGVNITHNGISFQDNEMWIEDGGVVINKQDIEIGPRIGVGYAAEDSLLPYRYVLNYNQYIKKTP